MNGRRQSKHSSAAAPLDTRRIALDESFITKGVSGMKTLISNLRAYFQLSQAGFAAPLGLSPTHIARFEKGVSIPSPETIDEICKVFCVDRRYFEGSIYTPDTPDILNEGSSPNDHSVDESSVNRVQMSVESARIIWLSLQGGEIDTV